MKNHDDMEHLQEDSQDIAIIGLAGRFPEARDTQEFWQNLVEGVDAIRPFSEEQILAAGHDPASLQADEDYVLKGGFLGDVDLFDAELFGYNPQEATLLDPQHRLLLEVSWHALENAGYDTQRAPASTGVFVGKAKNNYLTRYILPNRKLHPGYEDLLMVLGNESDYLATCISYRLGLNGPSMNIHTACSTSLVAVHQAKQSLLNYECDMALAGGVCIRLPEAEGYGFNEGNILSSDAHTRSYADNADGTVFSNGAGIVVLKRLSEALQDRDHIHAVIKGSAVNNDGPERQGYMAPSVNGQAEVIMLAQADAEVSAEEISYVEGHGTATPLGDPIEVAALTEAFRDSTDKTQYCALGSVKSNIGHLDAAAGISGLIKTTLSLKQGVIPASINCREVNPKLSIESTPFYINARTRPWAVPSDQRRIAGVSSFGAGGTNAHVVVAEAPESEFASSARPYSLLVWSAQSESAAQQMSARLADNVQQHSEFSLADTAYTLQMGRRQFAFRQFSACTDKEEAIQSLTLLRNKSITQAPSVTAPLVMLFPGQGSQYANMARTLYQYEPEFRNCFDQICDILDELLQLKLRDIIFPDIADLEQSEESLQQTAITQPAVFAVEYSLARFWMSLGIKAEAMIGHSIGEYVAATLAGVFSLQDALAIVAERGRIIQSLPAGSMIAVSKSADRISELLPRSLSVSVVNTPDSCVVGGECGEVADFCDQLAERKISFRRLRTSHAFHSAMMEPAVEEFQNFIAKFALSPPQIPIVSSSTGEWLDSETATNPAYWASHIRNPVLFSKAVSRVEDKYQACIWLETGPGSTLSSLTRASCKSPQTIISSLGHAQDQAHEATNLMNALGKLWTLGINIDWMEYYRDESRSRVPLPTYPLERKSFWVKGQPVFSMADGTRPAIPAQQVASSVEIAPNSHEEESLAPEQPLDRVQTLTHEIKELLSSISGIPVEDLDEDCNFLRLGFDSLFLTQASTALKRTFKQEISFRQLLEQTPDIRSLAQYLDSVLETPEVQDTAVEPDSKEVRPAIISDPENVGSHGPWRQLRQSQEDELTEDQQRTLDQFIEAYCTKTTRSKLQAQQHRGHFADPRSIASFDKRWKELVYPIVAEQSSAASMRDIDGNEYLDVQSGFGSVFFGHNAPMVREAITRQLEFGMQVGPQHYLAGKVAETLCRITGHERATFCNTGSEAVLAAMRTARTVTGRNKIVMFKHDYHGIFDEVIVRGAGTAEQPASFPAAPGIPPESVSNIVVLDYGDRNCFRTLQLIRDDLAAVMVEPVQSRQPDLQPREFLHEIRQWTKDHGVALIFDEVITGFRLHPRGAQGWFDVDADICTYGKIVGGTMPIGVVAGSALYLDALDGGQWQYGDDSFPEVGVTYFAGTFVRHPLTIAAADAAMDYIEQQGEPLYQALNKNCDAFVDTLNTRFQQLAVPLHLQHCGSMMYLQFLHEGPYNTLLYYYLRYLGVYILDGGSFFLTLAHTEQDIHILTEKFEEAATWMQSNGFLPASTTINSEENSFTLTLSQQEIWLATAVGDDASCAYNLCLQIDLKGTLDTDRLKSSLFDLVNLHDSLRMKILTDGTAVIEPEITEIACQESDISSLSEAKQAHYLAALGERETKQVFQLEDGEMIRFKLVALGPEHHQLLMTTHHIASDGWSCGLLVKHLGRLYKGEHDSLKDELLSYRDYARWLELPEQQARRQSDREYWLGLHKNTVADLNLPLDKPRPPLKTYSAGVVYHELNNSLGGQLNQLAREQDTTLYHLLLSVYQVLLFRLSGQTNFAVGIPIAGQMHSENSNLVGHCVSMAALNPQLRAEMSFAELLEQTKHQVFDAFEHPFYNYGELIRDLDRQNDRSRNPLISTTFNVDIVDSSIDFGELEHHFSSSPRSFEIFEMFLDIVIDQGNIRLCCTYNNDLFHQETVQRWMAMYQELLSDVTRDLTTPIDSLSLLSTDQLDTIKALGQGETLDLDSSQLLPELIAVSAKQHAQRAAIKASNDQGSQTVYSYTALVERSDTVARYLNNRGIAQGSLVGVYMERSIDLPVVLLGILKSGAAYVPLDPAFPPSRISYMIEDAQPGVIISENAIAGNETGNNPLEGVDNVVLLDEINSDQPEEITSATIAIHPQDPAYVIYTSGSTGKPKGVVISHQALSNFMLSMAESPGIKEGDTLLAVTTFSFDISILELFLPLSVGATTVVASKDQSLDGDELLAMVDTFEIDILQATPATWRLLLAAGLGSQSRPLKALCGGEALPDALALELTDACAELWNMYGPTETTIWSAIQKITAESPKPLIGRPIHNTRLMVLDRKLQALPYGVAGDLYIGGSGLAQGYLNRRELTDSRFIPDPVKPDSRIYNTGDQVSLNADGTLNYLGRVDDQVKVRGYRIELGEIEAVIRSHPDIVDCAVSVRTVSELDTRLVAHIVWKQHPLTLTELRKYLSNELPSYMFPQALHSIDALPQTLNGKLDRKALPEQTLAVAAESNYEEPVSPQEKWLANLWQSTIGIEKAGRYDNFFDLGGHSLLSMEVIRLVHDEHGVRLHPRDILRDNLQQIAARLPDSAEENKLDEQPGKPLKSRSMFDRLLNYKALLRN